MKNIYIIGAGGFGREVAWLIEDINKVSNEWNILGFIDENKDMHGKDLNGYKVLGNIEFLNSQEEAYITIAIGNGKIREKTINALDSKFKYPVLVHPNVVMSNLVNIGEGSIICAGNIITVNIEIGNHVIVNIDSTIGHDTILQDYTTILPSVNISGNVLLGKYTTMGTNSTIIQGLKVGSGVMIGAGAVVVKELPNNCTAVGNPAKVIKIHE